MIPEYSPRELEEIRLKRDIEAMAKAQAPRESEFENFAPQKPRKTKRKKGAAIARDKESFRVRQGKL